MKPMILKEKLLFAAFALTDQKPFVEKFEIVLKVVLKISVEHFYQQPLFSFSFASFLDYTFLMLTKLVYYKIPFLVMTD